MPSNIAYTFRNPIRMHTESGFKNESALHGFDLDIIEGRIYSLNAEFADTFDPVEPEAQHAVITALDLALQVLGADIVFDLNPNRDETYSIEPYENEAGKTVRTWRFDVLGNPDDPNDPDECIKAFAAIPGAVIIE